MKIDKNILFERVIEILLVFVVGAALLLTHGCKSVRSVESVAQRDSVQTRVVHDTTYIAVHDTIFIEVQQSIRTDEGTTIEFGEGGGSYNARTGAAENVKSVREQKKSEQDTQIKAEWSHQEEVYKTSIDSLRTAVRELQAENEQLSEPKDCNHLRIFLCGLAAGVAAVYAVRLIGWLIRKYYLRR